MTTHKDEQRERREVLKNDKRVARERGATFHQFGSSDAESVSGRYAQVSRSTVTGSGPVAYPALPENSPWHDDLVGPEPPINFAEMSAPEPVGTHGEIAQSLGEVHSDNPSASDSASPGGGEVRGTDPYQNAPPLRSRRRATRKKER